MAEIFLAKRFGSAGFVKTVAVKRIRPELSHDARFVSLFRDEARIAAKLDHPCIAQVMDFGEASGSSYLCMEYVAGQDLRNILQRCAKREVYLPVSAALRIAGSVLEALEYAHGFSEQGRPLRIVHRDVSPTNVMVSYSGSVKLLDFGIARATSRVSKALGGELTGKISYVAPEQVRGLAVDSRADLWSLGLTLFEALTNRRLFTHRSEREVMEAVLDEPIPSVATLRPDLPDGVAPIVARALERDIDRRYQSAAAMHTDIDRVLARIAPGRGVGELAQVMADLFEADHPYVPAPASDHDVTRLDSTTPPHLVLERRAYPDERPTPVVDQPVVFSAPAAVVEPPRRSRGRSGAFAAALVLAVVVGVWAFKRGATQAPRPPLVTQAAVPAVEAPALVAAPPPAPAPPSPPVEAPPVEKPAAERPRREERPSLRPLSPREAGSAFARARNKLLDCFNQHSESLSQQEGELTLSVVVVQSGAVKEAAITSPPVGSPALSQCIVERVKKIQFRKQPDKEVRINVPFVYRVTD
jgi:serine/threonine-protein kinase